MPARKIDYPTWLPRQIGGSRVKDSEKLVTKGDLPRQSGRNSRIPAIFAEHRPSPALLRTGNGYRLPASGVESPPVSTSQSRSAASADDQAVTAERCAAQLLCGDPAGSAGEVAGRLLAIQAQDARGARLAIRARSAGLSASDVDSALTRRSLIVTWLNRGTLHLVRAEDYWWLHPLTTPPAAHRELPPAGARGRTAGRRGPGGGRRAGRAGRRRPADPASAPGAGRRRGGADRRPGDGAHLGAGQHPGPDRARPGSRTGPGVRAGPGLAGRTAASDEPRGGAR